MTRRAWLLAGMAAVAAGCAPRIEELPPAKFQLPKEYSATASQTRSKPMPWSEYFEDPELRQLVSRALNDNLDLRVALQRIEVARAGVRLATGARLPQVGVGAGVGVSKESRHTVEGGGNATTEVAPGRLAPDPLPDFSVGLEASWELDLWGRLKSLRESAVAQYLATLQGTHLVVTTLVSDVAVAYFDLAALDQSLTVVQETVARQEEALEVMQLQKQAGRVNQLAVQQFGSELASSRALQSELVQKVQEVETQLNVLAGRLPQRVGRKPGVLLEKPGVTVLASVPSDLLEHRPDIREAELQLQAAKCDVEAARAAFYPSVTITGSAGFRAFDPRYLVAVPESATYGVSAGLFAPIVNRSAIQAAFQAASALQVQAMYQYQSVILKGFAEVSTSIAAVERAAETVSHRRTQRDALAEAVGTADLLLRAGKASYLEVLTAQQQTLAAELELIDSLRAQRVSGVLLYKALGGGWR